MVTVWSILNFGIPSRSKNSDILYKNITILLLFNLYNRLHSSHRSSDILYVSGAELLKVRKNSKLVGPIGSKPDFEKCSYSARCLKVSITRKKIVTLNLLVTYFKKFGKFRVTRFLNQSHG